MAAHDYYNSFNGGNPQMMQSQPFSNQPHSDAPPPYQPFSAQGQPHSQHQNQARYNIADYKPGYQPGVNYEYQDLTPPQLPPQPYYPPSQEQRPHYPPRPQIPQINTGPPQDYVYSQRPYKSTTNLRPQRSYSEPPSPLDRDSSSSRPPHRRHHHHHHSHSHSRRRSRSRDRERDRDGHRKRPVHSEKKTFLGAIGGSVVGDLIFPGLGTIGGAVLGGWGGHEAAKKKEERERDERRPRRRNRSYEGEWEEGKRRRGDY